MKTSVVSYPILFNALLAAASAPNPGSEWTNTLFLDDFSGSEGDAPNSDNWKIDTGTSYPGGASDWGTGEIETYTSSSSNVKLSGSGTLLIIPEESDGSWTSGRIETQDSSYQAPSGGKMRIEASIKLPNIGSSDGSGYWPAFWALGGNFRDGYSDWPACGEFDIMESVDGNEWTSHTMHCGSSSGGPCDETTGLSSRENCPNSNCLGEWHTYTLIVDRSVSPEEINFNVDGTTEYTVSEDTVGSSTWDEAVHHGLYVILNVAIGGGYPNGVAGTTTPNSATVSGQAMEVDYVAVWTT